MTAAVSMARVTAAAVVVAVAAIGSVVMAADAAGGVGIQQAFLVQNSGWMEPFYVDPSSRLKPLVAAVAAAVTTTDDTVFMLAFSQSSGVNPSPVLLAKTQGGADVGRALGALTVAHKGGAGNGTVSGAALADTDLKEAITRTITGPFNARPGIVWIFTNNKNSPNNDAQTAARNRDFYRLLHLEPSITKTLAFPLKMPVRGKLYEAKGLMVYALAYGKPGAEALDRIMAEGHLSRVLTHAPARLKPIDQDAVRIVPTGVKDAPNMRASLAADQRTLVLDVAAAGLVPEVTLHAALENLFHPYVIRQGVVEAALQSGAQHSPVRVSPTTIQGLQPGARQSVDVSFTLPMARVPSVWSVQAMAAMGKQVLLPMTLEMTLTGQQLGVSDAFAAELGELFPGDPISEVFTPADSVRASQVRVPLLVRVQYPLGPLVALMAGLLALLALPVGLAFARKSSKRYELLVDGMKCQVLLKRFASVAISDGDGRPVGEVQRGAGQPRVVSVVEGHSLTLVER